MILYRTLYVKNVMKVPNTEFNRDDVMFFLVTSFVHLLLCNDRKNSKIIFFKRMLKGDRVCPVEIFG
jgi:hypothetical protein